MLLTVTRYSLAIPMIEDRIEHKTVDISVVTSSKPFEFSRADCGYVIAPYFSSSTKSVKCFIMIRQVTLRFLLLVNVVIS